jgi:S1-C subfamily serine protease
MRTRTILLALVAVVGGVTGIAAAAPHDPQPSDTNTTAPAPAAPSDAPVVHQGHGRLGFAALQITPDLRAYLGAPADRGVLVQQVRPDRPAARAGLRVGDVILEVDGDAVRSAGDVIAAIADRKKGDVVAMQIERDKQRLTLQATLADDPAPAGRFDGGTWKYLEPGELPSRFRQMFSDPETRRALEDTRKRMDELERRLDQLEREHH